MLVFLGLFVVIPLCVGLGLGFDSLLTVSPIPATSVVGSSLDDVEKKRRFWNERRLYKLFRPGYVLELYEKTTKGWEKFDEYTIIATTELGLKYYDKCNVEHLELFEHLFENRLKQKWCGGVLKDACDKIVKTFG